MKKDFEVYEGDKDDFATVVWAILVTFAVAVSIANADGFQNLPFWPTVVGVSIPTTAWIAFFRESVVVQRFWAFTSLGLSILWVVLFAVLKLY